VSKIIDENATKYKYDAFYMTDETEALKLIQKAVDERMSTKQLVDGVERLRFEWIDEFGRKLTVILEPSTNTIIASIPDL
jgi:uncharacterized FlaG/YvyC family protein